MTNPVAALHAVVDGEYTYHWVMTHCPGCDMLHPFTVILEGDNPKPGKPYWQWDGNLESPTFSPSYLTYWTQGNDKRVDDPEYKTEERRCHSFLINGKWQFLDDSTHHLKGKTVDMVPGPDWWKRDED